MDQDQRQHDGGATGVAADQEAAGALFHADNEDHRQGDRCQHVDDRGDEESPGALLEAEEGEQVLVEGQDPEAADRDPRQVGRGLVEQRFGDRPGERQRDQRRDRGEPEQRREGSRDDAGGVLVVPVVEAQQRLDHAEADDDAGRDDGGEHHFGGAVVAGREVARVERQQRHRDQLRDDAGRGVGGPGRR